MIEALEAMARTRDRRITIIIQLKGGLVDLETPSNGNSAVPLQR